MTELSSARPITIEWDPAWEGQGHSRVRAFLEQAGHDRRHRVDPTSLVLETILVHEVGHELHCPRDEANAKLMRMPSPSLEGPHKYSWALSQFTVNLVADILVNVCWSTTRPGYESGLLLAWYDQGAAPRYAATCGVESGISCAAPSDTGSSSVTSKSS